MFLPGGSHRQGSLEGYRPQGLNELNRLKWFSTRTQLKVFSVVNEAEVDVSLELPCFLYDPTHIGDLISISSAFSKSRVYIWKFSVQALLKPSLKDVELYVASMWNEHSCAVVWTFLGLTLLWDWKLCSSLNTRWPCPSLGLEWKHTFYIPVPIAEFTKVADYWVQYFTASSYKILSSSAGIPSPPPALFVVMLPKAHLTSHSQISGSKRVATPSRSLGSLRTFFVQFCVFLPPADLFCFC